MLPGGVGDSRPTREEAGVTAPGGAPAVCGERRPGVLWPNIQPRSVLPSSAWWDWWSPLLEGRGGRTKPQDRLRAVHRAGWVAVTPGAARGSWLPVGAAPACTWLVRRGKCADTGSQTCFLTGLSREKKKSMSAGGQSHHIRSMDFWLEPSQRPLSPGGKGPGRIQHPIFPWPLRPWGAGSGLNPHLSGRAQ